VRVIVSWLANKKRLESLSWKIDIDWALHWVVSYKTNTENTDIWIGIDYDICDEPWVLDWVVSCKTDAW